MESKAKIFVKQCRKYSLHGLWVRKFAFSVEKTMYKTYLIHYKASNVT